MDLKDLILLMWRNIRYIVLGLALGAGIGIFVTKIQAPVYEAGTKVFISRARQQGNSDMLSLSDEQLLAILPVLPESMRAAAAEIIETRETEKTDKLRTFVGKLQSKRDKCVVSKREIETRWATMSVCDLAIAE